MTRFNHGSIPRHTDLAEAQKDIEDLHAALATQPVIDQAKGILMAQHGCRPEHAFRMLAEASQRENRKLRDVAAAVVASVQSTPVGRGIPPAERSTVATQP